jgi:hypothetical protein
MTDNLAPDAVVPRTTVDWYRSTPWWRLVSHTVTISWRASHLLLCAAALGVTWMLTSISFWMFQPEQIVAPMNWLEPASHAPAMAPFDRELPQVIEAMSPSGETPPASSWYPRSPDSFLGVWRRYLESPYQAIQFLTVRRAAYLLFNVLAVIGVWSLVGGLLARRSIQEFGTRITAPWSDTFSLVYDRWLSIAWAAAMPTALVMMCCLLPLILGWLSNIPAIGPWIAGLLMIPLAIMSLGLGWCAAVTVFGFPLSLAAIVCEKKADAFDGVSRAAAYAFQKPVTLILAVIAAEWIGHLAGGLVSVAVNTGFAVLERAFDIGSFQSLASQGTIWDSPLRSFVPLILTAFGFSFFWSASSAIYLILRREVDHAEFDLIDMDAPGLPKPLPPLPESPGSPVSPGATTDANAAGPAASSTSDPAAAAPAVAVPEQVFIAEDPAPGTKP